MHFTKANLGLQLDQHVGSTATTTVSKSKRTEVVKGQFYLVLHLEHMAPYQLSSKGCSSGIFKRVFDQILSNRTLPRKTSVRAPKMKMTTK